MEIVKDSIADAHDAVVRAIIEDGAEQKIEVEPGRWMVTWEYPEPIMIIVRHPSKPPLKSKASLFGNGFIEQYKKDILTITSKKGMTEMMKRENGTGFKYTYPDRLFDYPRGISDFDEGDINGNGNGAGIDQIGAAIAELVNSPQSRRANAITWVPELDIGSTDPPCLQFTHFMVRRGIPDFNQDPTELYLTGRFPFRSHDMMSGYGANAIALLGLMEYVAGKVGTGLGKKIYIGNLITFSSSAHIYCEAQSQELREFKKVLRIS